MSTDDHQEDPPAPIADGAGAGCWGGSWCGRHCKAINWVGSPCVRAVHPEPVHVWGTPPCDPNAAIKEPLDFDGPKIGPTTRTTHGHVDIWGRRYSIIETVYTGEDAVRAMVRALTDPIEDDDEDEDEDEDEDDN